MSLNYYRIVPQIGVPQKFSVVLAGVTYQLTLRFRVLSAAGAVSTAASGAGSLTMDSALVTMDSSVTIDTSSSISVDQSSAVAQQQAAGVWVLDIADASGNDILSGLPLVTGADLLAQYGYLGFGGGLWVQTASAPDAPPTFDNLGDDGQVYWVVETLQ